LLRIQSSSSAVHAISVTVLELNYVIMPSAPTFT
jgi:hypothetical protein